MTFSRFSARMYYILFHRAKGAKQGTFYQQGALYRVLFEGVCWDTAPFPRDQTGGFQYDFLGEIPRHISLLNQLDGAEVKKHPKFEHVTCGSLTGD